MEDGIEEYTFDDNGIPTLHGGCSDNSSSKSTPVNHPRQTHYHRQLPDYNEAGPSSNFANVGVLQSHDFSNQEDLNDIFDIMGEGYDCCLSMATQTLSWTMMNPGGRRRRPRSKNGLKSLFKTYKVVKKKSLNLREIIGVKIRRRRCEGQERGEGFCLGFGALTYSFKSANALKADMIHFEHPSEDICHKWVTKISEVLETFQERPKSVKLFLQKYAGDKSGLTLYQKTILPLFRTADCNVDMTEIQHNEQIKQDLIHLNLLDYDCLVCMGGDGTVNKVVNGLLNQSNKDYGIEIKRNGNPVAASIPLGIIPTGKTNHIAQSVFGVDDPVTGVLHILYGNRYKVDVCSIYNNDKLQRWAFNSQYGFAGNVLTFISRYSAIGSKKVEASFLKALTKSKLKSYECDIEYIPATGVIAPMSCTKCYTHCKICTSSTNTVHNDVVEELDPMGQSGSTSSLIDLSENPANPWKTLKGNFMNVGIFTISGICEFAPQGLSKFTHLNDGCMDLAVVKNVDRKDFIRFLRRHGNSKNQFDFPFVETFRVKEVRFRPRFPKSWSYKNHDFNEIDYEMSKINKQTLFSRSKSMQVITDVDIEDRTSVHSSAWGGNNADSVMTLQALSIDSDMEDSDLPSEINNKTNFNVQSQMNLTGPQYRMTFNDKERLRRKKIERKKEEKERNREERKMRSVWNIDNEICDVLELDFKVHQGLITICGIGINPHTLPEDIRFGCLPGL